MFSRLLVASLLGLALANPSTNSLGTLDLSKRISSDCPSNVQLSCHNTTTQTNLCCFQSPGGLLLQTQFWDTDPSTGPSDSWTIHGLWPDNCDTTFQENCDPSRDYTDISGLLTAAGATDTLDFMNQFWLDDDGENEQFWEHEWATHGTCMSTLDPSCLPAGSARGAEAVAFFNTVVRLFQTLPTFSFLSSQGITPTTSKTFTLSELTDALQAASGFIPTLDCDSDTLDQITWYFNLQGSVIDGTFVPIDAPETGSCPSKGIKYPPKSTSSSGGSSSSTSAPVPTTSPGALPAKAMITAVSSNGGNTGGLISAGTWSVQTLATYTLSGTTSSFTMKSSKGDCAIQSGTFTCASTITTPSSFSAESSGGQLLLAFDGSTAFSSDAVPSGIAQETVFTGSGHADSFSLVITAS